MRVYCHLVLILTEVLDGVGRSRIALEARHHELLREAVRSDILEERRVKGAQPKMLRLLLEKMTYFLNLLPDDLLDVPHARSFRGPMRPRVLRVLNVTRGE